MGYPIYPNVPDVPGVPPLSRLPTTANQVANLVGSISGNTLSVSAVSGNLFAGASLTGAGVATGTSIVNQLSGATGGLGSYAVSVAQNFTGALTSTFTPFSSALSGLSDDGPDLPGPADPQAWGIYKDGAAVILADNVVSLDYKKDWNVSNYQQEEGAFASYNKVANPYDAKVQFSTGGSVQDKQDFIESIEAIAADLNLYDVVTPEKTYSSANITYNGYRRTAVNGVGLLKIDVYLEEIRVTATEDFTTTAQPSGTDAVNGGTVQTTTPTPQQTSIIAGFLGNG